MRPQPSCATASREFPDIFTPISTLVKQTCAGLGTPGVSHQLVKPDLIGMSCKLKHQVWGAGLFVTAVSC